MHFLRFENIKINKLINAHNLLLYPIVWYQYFIKVFKNFVYCDMGSTGGPRYSRVWYSRFWLFAVNNLIPKFAIRGSFPCLFAVFVRNRVWICQNRDSSAFDSGPLLFAVLVFAGHSRNVTPANNEGRLYYYNYTFCSLQPLLRSLLPSLTVLSYVVYF